MIFAIQALGFGDDENAWENIGYVTELRSARKTVLKLQREWDEEYGDNFREARRQPGWRASYRYQSLSTM